MDNINYPKSIGSHNRVIYKLIVWMEIDYRGEILTDRWWGRHYEDWEKSKIGMEGMPHVKVFLQFQRYADVFILQVKLVEVYWVGCRGVQCCEVKDRSQDFYTLLCYLYRMIILLCQFFFHQRMKSLKYDFNLNFFS